MYHAASRRSSSDMQGLWIRMRLKHATKTLIFDHLRSHVVCHYMYKDQRVKINLHWLREDFNENAASAKPYLSKWFLHWPLTVYNGFISRGLDVNENNSLCSNINNRYVLASEMLSRHADKEQVHVLDAMPQFPRSVASLLFHCIHRKFISVKVPGIPSPYSNGLASAPRCPEAKRWMLEWKTETLKYARTNCWVSAWMIMSISRCWHLKQCLVLPPSNNWSHRM